MTKTQIDQDVLAKLVAEYRLTMPEEVLRDWAKDVVTALSAAPVDGDDAWRKAAEVVLAEVKVQGIPALEFIDRVLTPDSPS